MPIEEDTFYDANGFEVSRTNLVQQMIQYYDEKLSIGETRVTDFNEGSEIRNLLEAVAVDVYNLMEQQNNLTKIAFVETAEAEWLDKHGANPFINLPRDAGNYATGFVTFSIPEAVNEDINLPAGLILVNNDGLQYSTENDLILPAGETSITGSAICLTTGKDGNCLQNNIIIIDDNDVIGINGLTVNNPEAFTGGTDYEEDEDYRKRLLDFIRQDDFGSLGYYEKLCNGVDGVHDVLFVDASGVTKKCLVNGDVKETPDSVLLAVEEVLSTPNNLVVGHNFTVAKPSYTTLNLVVNLEVTVELDTDKLNTFIQAVIDGGKPFNDFEFEGVNIGETLFKDELYEAFYLWDNITSVQILRNNSEIGDISPSSSIHVFKLGTVTFNQTVVNNV